jgi:hypothetical protein
VRYGKRSDRLRSAQSPLASLDLRLSPPEPQPFPTDRAKVPPPPTCSHILARGLLIVLMMDAASISETSANFYRTTRCNNEEDSHLLTYNGRKIMASYVDR